MFARIHLPFFGSPADGGAFRPELSCELSAVHVTPVHSRHHVAEMSFGPQAFQLHRKLAVFAPGFSRVGNRSSFC